jgi:hypothetical protein
MSAERRPDFFIVGAPKGGTTAMYHYLRLHPELFLPARKELRFFGADLDIRDRRPLTTAEYLACFDEAGDAARVGTAYVWYLYSRTAAREIAEFAPGAQIIAMLRNPVEMLPALHSENLSNGNEEIADFDAAWEAEADRRAGRRIPPHAHLPQGLLYSEVPRYAEQIERYFKAFGRDRVRVILFDEFRADPATAYRDTLAFLGVADDFRPPSFAVINANRRLRSERLRHFLARPPAAPRRLIHHLVPRPVRRGLYDWAKGLNVRSVPRRPLSDATRERIRAAFRDEVTRLSELLGRDLSSWSARDEPDSRTRVSDAEALRP